MLLPCPPLRRFVRLVNTRFGLQINNPINAPTRGGNVAAPMGADNGDVLTIGDDDGDQAAGDDNATLSTGSGSTALVMGRGILDVGGLGANVLADDSSTSDSSTLSVGNLNASGIGAYVLVVGGVGVGGAIELDLAKQAT
jgi:hypothetical protein